MKILDACCGSRSMWFDKKDSRALFMDIRNSNYSLSCQKTYLEVKPDVIGDFRNMSFDDNSFSLVVFDPPHVKRQAESDITKRYGKLGEEWKKDLTMGFKECVRVLKPNGTLIFKWSETQFKIHEVLELCELKPLFGHKTTKTTIWVAFIK